MFDQLAVSRESNTGVTGLRDVEMKNRSLTENIVHLARRTSLIWPDNRC